MFANEEKEKFIDRLGRVAVLYGGASAEREISLQSGQAVMKALQEEGVEVVAIETKENPLQDILTAKVDRAFIALHGPGGEDGKIQALLEFLNIPYTGSGVAASALCMDKVRTKQLWSGVGLPTPEFVVLQSNTDWRKAIKKLSGRAMVKPCHEGSSIGMALVSNAEDLEKAYKIAAEFDDLVLAEQFISGPEYTIAVLNGKALPPIKLHTNNQFYDFNAKYESNDTEYLCPCGLEPEGEEKLKALALRAFESVGAEGWGRVDVMATENGDFQLLELNTVPGMTSHSLVPMAAMAAGYSFNDLILEIVKPSLAV